jgi:hypothetical protein
MPKLHEVTGETKTEIYCRGTVCRRCVLAALLAVKLGLNVEIATEVFWKNVFLTNLEQMFKRRATDQRPKCALKNARFLHDGWCYHKNTSDKIPFRINRRHVNQGFNVTS